MPPRGEDDGFDETLVFYDFELRNPMVGRINDDELFGLFGQASEYKILVLVDACHSSGMVRSTGLKTGNFRSAGFWEIKPGYRGLSQLPPLPSVHPETQKNKKNSNNFRV